jgi:hypothetical protein
MEGSSGRLGSRTRFFEIARDCRSRADFLRQPCVELGRPLRRLLYRSGALGERPFFSALERSFQIDDPAFEILAACGDGSELCFPL